MVTGASVTEARQAGRVDFVELKGEVVVEGTFEGMQEQ